MVTRLSDAGSRVWLHGDQLLGEERGYTSIRYWVEERGNTEISYWVRSVVKHLSDTG